MINVDDHSDCLKSLFRDHVIGSIDQYPTFILSNVHSIYDLSGLNSIRNRKIRFRRLNLWFTYNLITVLYDATNIHFIVICMCRLVNSKTDSVTDCFQINSSGII